MCVYIYIYIYTHTYIHTYTYISVRLVGVFRQPLTYPSGRVRRISYAPLAPPRLLYYTILYYTIL